jgi:hypothetical protein
MVLVQRSRGRGGCRDSRLCQLCNLYDRMILMNNADLEYYTSIPPVLWPIRCWPISERLLTTKLS